MPCAILLVVTLDYIDNMLRSSVHGGYDSVSWDYWKDPMTYVIIAGTLAVINSLGWPIQSSKHNHFVYKLILLISAMLLGGYLFLISYSKKNGYWIGAHDYFAPNETYNATGSFMILFAIINLIPLVRQAWRH